MLPPQKQKQVADRDASDRLAGDLAALVGSDERGEIAGEPVRGVAVSNLLLFLRR